MSGLEPGQRFAERYEIVERIGEGGMGVVYAARDVTLRRPVAIKVLSPGRVGNKNARARLKREARTAATFADPGIAQVFDFGETPEGGAYLVMELVHGKVVRGKPPERPETLRIVREVARTLDAAHALGLVHRDVKPDNIMIRDDGRVTLLDFGIAKDVGPGRRSTGDEVDSVVTAQGTVLGSPPYISPEQIKGKDVGPASDQFALAVVAFVFLTGKKPWESVTELGMLGQILMEPALRACALSPSLPAAVDAVFDRALAKEPSQRYPDVKAFAAALEAAVQGAPRATEGAFSASIEVVLDEVSAPAAPRPAAPEPAPAPRPPAASQPGPDAAGGAPPGPAYQPPVWKFRVDEPEAPRRSMAWLVVGAMIIALAAAAAGVWYGRRAPSPPLPPVGLLAPPR